MNLLRKALNYICEKNMSNTTDHVTGLSNRLGLYNYYKKSRSGEDIHVIYVDVDNFRQVNDVFGYSTGDELLYNIGKCISQVIDDEFVARTGGDEFMILISGKKSSEYVYKLVDTIIFQINNSDFRKDILSIIGVNAGVILNQNKDQVLDDIFTKCKIAMYQARALGKNNYVVYSSNDPTIEINKNIEAEMEHAIKAREFEVYLQPKVNMLNHSVIGAEALARWNHPVDGQRMPSQFIPVFEKNGFILKLDLYIFEEVCKIKKKWKNTIFEKLVISFNMDRLHFYQSDFPDLLYKISERYGVSPKELEIEITESMFFKNSEQLIFMVQQLREKGFLVSIDDFGSGYSALNMIKDVPSDTIKIDRIFLGMSVNSNRGKKILRNVINMCREIKVQIVAEGVEDKEHIEFLTGCGCHIAQGFYYSRPINLKDFEKFSTELGINNTEGIRFSFSNTFESENGEYSAVFDGSKYSFENGAVEGTGSIRLLGGEKTQELMRIPTPIFYQDSYTIAMWVRPEKMIEWGSFIYVKYENGYITISMNAVDGKLTYRIRDIKEVEGWHDVVGDYMELDVWTHITVSYDYMTEIAKLYVNGELVNTLDDVPTMSYARLAYVGGDVYKDSVQGNISELIIYGEVKSDEEIKELYKNYI